MWYGRVGVVLRVFVFFCVCVGMTLIYISLCRQYETWCDMILYNLSYIYCVLKIRFSRGILWTNIFQQAANYSSLLLYSLFLFLFHFLFFSSHLFSIRVPARTFSNSSTSSPDINKICACAVCSVHYFIVLFCILEWWHFCLACCCRFLKIFGYINICWLCCCLWLGSDALLPGTPCMHTDRTHYLNFSRDWLFAHSYCSSSRVAHSLSPITHHLIKQQQHGSLNNLIGTFSLVVGMHAFCNMFEEGLLTYFLTHSIVCICYTLSSLWTCSRLQHSETL